MQLILTQTRALESTYRALKCILWGIIYAHVHKSTWSAMGVVDRRGQYQTCGDPGPCRRFEAKSFSSLKIRSDAYISRFGDFVPTATDGQTD